MCASRGGRCMPCRSMLAPQHVLLTAVKAHQGSESLAVLLSGAPRRRPCKPAARAQRYALPDLLPCLHMTHQIPACISETAAQRGLQTCLAAQVGWEDRKMCNCATFLSCASGWSSRTRVRLPPMRYCSWVSVKYQQSSAHGILCRCSTLKVLHMPPPAQACRMGEGTHAGHDACPSGQVAVPSACLVSVANVTWSVSPRKPLNTTVRTLGRPSVRTVASCMNLC